MDYKQKDYYISAKENEYYKVLNVVDYMLEEAQSNNKYPVWGGKLRTELKESAGNNLTPWHFNMIISTLLDYVPDEVKNKSNAKSL
ncbi:MULTISPECIES: hypothetical protein [Priestia]|uniref:hypothetical protein n=1 Tax=Priestia TaxID=2800373 RepID=UPI000BF27B95|nr:MULTISPECIES: hypothetical protein [Priestia]MCM3641284.1 hypothetical protein [Priestia aryabhattai]PFW71807.1 hypothetical protein COL23_26570 [Priestia aryabhattai]